MAEKSAKKKPKKAQASVLGSLPSTRPARLGGDRRAGAARTPQATAAKSPGTTTARAPKATAAKAPRAKAKPASTTAPPAGWQVPSDGGEHRHGGPAEVVTTAVQAAGELAQIGATVGRQFLKRAVDRIPRP
jgi:hypothetical protein